jgi:hypothetical protein
MEYTVAFVPSIFLWYIIYHVSQKRPDLVAGISLSLFWMDHLLLNNVTVTSAAVSRAGKGGHDCHAPVQGLWFKHPAFPPRGFLETPGIRKLWSSDSLSFLTCLPNSLCVQFDASSSTFPLYLPYVTFSFSYT